MLNALANLLMPAAPLPVTEEATVPAEGNAFKDALQETQAALDPVKRNDKPSPAAEPAKAEDNPEPKPPVAVPLLVVPVVEPAPLPEVVPDLALLPMPPVPSPQGQEQGQQTDGFPPQAGIPVMQDPLPPQDKLPAPAEKPAPVAPMPEMPVVRPTLETPVAEAEQTVLPPQTPQFQPAPIAEQAQPAPAPVVPIQPVAKEQKPEKPAPVATKPVKTIPQPVTPKTDVEPVMTLAQTQDEDAQPETQGLSVVPEPVQPETPADLEPLPNDRPAAAQLPQPSVTAMPTPLVANEPVVSTAPEAVSAITAQSKNEPSSKYSPSRDVKNPADMEKPAYAPESAAASKPAPVSAPAATSGQPSAAPAPVQSPPTFDELVAQSQPANANAEQIRFDAQPAKHAPETANAGQPHLRGQVPLPVTDQISFHIRKAVDGGDNRIRIKMQPAALGHVDVKMEVGADGSLKAVVACDKAETFEWLQRDARHLERSLQEAGLKTDAGSLSFQFRGGDGQQRGFSEQFQGYDREQDGRTLIEATVSLATAPAQVRWDGNGSLNLEV